MSRKAREEKAAVAAPASVKPETKPAAAAAPAMKAAVPGEAKLKERVPMMSADVRVPPEEPFSDRPRESMTSAAPFKWADEGDGAFIARHASAAELAELRKRIEERQAAEAAAGPKFTFWRCPKCGRQERAGADAKSQDCFFCNPRLLSTGQQMTQITGEVGIAAFIEREKVEKARWLATLAKAKALAGRRDREFTLLRKHGL